MLENNILRTTHTYWPLIQQRKGAPQVSPSTRMEPRTTNAKAKHNTCSTIKAPAWCVGQVEIFQVVSGTDPPSTIPERRVWQVVSLTSPTCLTDVKLNLNKAPNRNTRVHTPCTILFHEVQSSIEYWRTESAMVYFPTKLKFTGEAQAANNNATTNSQPISWTPMRRRTRRTNQCTPRSVTEQQTATGEECKGISEGKTTATKRHLQCPAGWKPNIVPRIHTTSNYQPQEPSGQWTTSNTIGTQSHSKVSCRRSCLARGPPPPSRWNRPTRKAWFLMVSFKCSHANSSSSIRCPFIFHSLRLTRGQTDMALGAPLALIKRCDSRFVHFTKPGSYSLITVRPYFEDQKGKGGGEVPLDLCW